MTGTSNLKIRVFISKYGTVSAEEEVKKTVIHGTFMVDMKRLRILVHGRVQRVGYRDAVAEIARKLGVKGTVKNLDDEVSVEIIAEAGNKELEEFVKLIHIKDYAINVEKLDIKEEKPTSEFKFFKITRGDGFQEIGERLDTAGSLLYKSLEKQDALLGKQDAMLVKQDRTTDAIESMHKDMTVRFDTLDNKYGKISVTLERISVALETLAGIKK